jgi:hypothetical protein
MVGEGGGGHGFKCVLALNLNARVVNAGFSDAGFMNAVFLNAGVSNQLIALDIGLVVCRRYARDARCIYERMSVQLHDFCRRDLPTL